MRKIISLVIAGALFAGVVAFAEQDTSGGAKKTDGGKGKKKKHKTNDKKG